MAVRLPPVSNRQEVAFLNKEDTIRRSKSVPKQKSSDHFSIEKENKAKPLYVAKPLPKADCLSNQEEHPSPSLKHLGKIIEEGSELLHNDLQNFGNTVEVELADSLYRSDEAEPEHTTNIFEAERFDKSKYHEAFKGPRYQNGKIVRHSLAGKPEFFINYTRRMARIATFERDSSPVSRSSHNNISQTMKSIQDLSPPRFIRSESKKSTFSKLSLPVFRKENSKNTISRQELFEEINKLRGRQESFYSNMDKQAEQLPHSDKLTYTREKRVLEKFGKVLQKWDKTVEETNSKIGRAKSESVISKSENFREKVEIAEAFEVTKSDQQKFGISFWYLNLRKREGEKKGAFLKDDFPVGFQTVIMDRPKSTVEIIRKIRSLRASHESTLGNRSSHMSTGNLSERVSNRTAQEYLSQKLNASASLISQVKANGNGFEDLEVCFLRTLIERLIMNFLACG